MNEPLGSAHICDYVEPDGTTAGACHLVGFHLGMCDVCRAAAPDCVHQQRWEAVLLCGEPECEVHV